MRERKKYVKEVTRGVVALSEKIQNNLLIRWIPSTWCVAASKGRSRNKKPGENEIVEKWNKAPLLYNCLIYLYTKCRSATSLLLNMNSNTPFRFRSSHTLHLTHTHTHTHQLRFGFLSLENFPISVPSLVVDLFTFSQRKHRVHHMAWHGWDDGSARARALRIWYLHQMNRHTVPCDWNNFAFT